MPFAFPSPLYTIADTLARPDLSFVELAKKLCTGGARLLQLRVKDLPTREFLTIAHEVRLICQQAGCLLLINDRADIALAAELCWAQTWHAANALESGAEDAEFHVRAAKWLAGEEGLKPNGERLREFSSSGKASLELALLSEKPIYPDLEILTLTDSLTFLASQLGVDDPRVQEMLAGKSPRDRAVELIKGTLVREVAFRRKLYEGGSDAVSAANDPMIELARLIDPEARALRKVNEEQEEAKQQAHAAISRAPTRCSARRVIPMPHSRCAFLSEQ